MSVLARLPTPLVLAPMAGITDGTFRRLLRRVGGVGLVSMEFISAKGMTRRDPRVMGKLPFCQEERPLAIQIYGSRAEDMADAAEQVQAMGADVCDVNMGCPANKVLKGCAGAALMGDLREAERILIAIRRRLHIPLTVKFRAGTGREPVPVNFLELGRICEANGVDAVSLHPRTAKQFYTGEADWSRIRALKQALRIPVIGNGDVRRPEDVVRMMRETGCDGVMIGRATLHNPLIFRQAADLLRGRPPTAATPEEHRAFVLTHLRLLAAGDDRKLALHKLRTFLGWYSRGLPGGAGIRRRISAMRSVGELMDQVERFFSSAEEATGAGAGETGIDEWVARRGGASYGGAPASFRAQS